MGVPLGLQSQCLLCVQAAPIPQTLRVPEGGFEARLFGSGRVNPRGDSLIGAGQIVIYFAPVIRNGGVDRLL